ncbi:MAG: hypothetical protein GY806_21435, partial [Gammaproteobacteria bacterium]|nr:hypothetical protein [Gammaproteobacteria bacterium]
FLVTDTQHIPPVIRLHGELGGIVLTCNPEIFDTLQSSYKDLNIEAYLCDNERHAQRLIVSHRIRVVLYPSYHTLYRGKAIEIFHGGLSDKNYVESLKILVYDLVLFPGEKTRDKVEKSGYLQHIPEWEIVGYPKFDPLINATLKFTPEFNNGRKTILYAPTWVSQNVSLKFIRFSEYGESSLEIWAREIIRALHNDYNLIIKFHSRIYRQPGDIYQQIDELIKQLGAEQTVITKSDDNILPYMAQADLMISDISTACYEWFHFDKPIVFANPAPDKYRALDDIGSNTYAWQAGDVINRTEDILTMVHRNIEQDSYRAIRNRIFNYTVYRPDGHATQRQSAAIIEFYRRYERTNYWWLLFSSYLFRRYRRQKTKFINRYYRLFRKDRIGK